MADMSREKNKMPLRGAAERIKDYGEVALGYTPEQACSEAKRCLGCKNKPCVAGCPVGVDIPGFIAKIAEKDFDGAYSEILATNSFPAICGRVCPQENQCEKLCVRGRNGEPVAIGRLERFAADNGAEPEHKITKNGIKAAVVGSGPASLACASELAKNGYDVTVFEALHVAGGVLVYGIPEFRLPKEIVRREIENLKKMGVEIKTDIVIGKTMTVDELFGNGYKAVFLGTGAGLPLFLGIKGENLNGVYSANEFLTRVNLMKAYREDSQTPVIKAKKVAVVGGGNVAMDAARCALRLGAEEVSIIYRRSAKELPARAEEVVHAGEEGVKFRFLTNPIEIIEGEKGFAAAVKCVEMELGEPDSSGRRRPLEKQGSEVIIEADCVIIAIGTSPNPLIRSGAEGLEFGKKGQITADENGRTTRKNVYAGGDAVTGAATVILAMGAGKKAGEEIVNGEPL